MRTYLICVSLLLASSARAARVFECGSTELLGNQKTLFTISEGGATLDLTKMAPNLPKNVGSDLSFHGEYWKELNPNPSERYYTEDRGDLGDYDLMAPAKMMTEKSGTVEFRVWSEIFEDSDPNDNTTHVIFAKKLNCVLRADR